MSSVFYQAVGVVAGTYVPERNIVVGADGTTYPASCHPGVRRFFERNPEKAAQAKYLVCWPRTSDTGKQVHLTVTSAPVDPERQASLKREAGRFKISGVITNQRSKLNRVVVRVVRNETVPRNRRHESQFKTHLLFLTGRAAPFGNFVNKHTTFTCVLKGHELLIRGIEDTREPEVVIHEAGGLKLPWPFMATRKHVDLFCSLNGTGKAPCLVPADFRDRLQLRLRQMDLLVSERSALNADEDHLITDRIRKVRQRLQTFTRRMGDGELELLLEETGLLAALAKLDLEPTPNPIPETTMQSTYAAPEAITNNAAKKFPEGLEKVIRLPPDLRRIADQVLAGAPDALLAMAPKMNSKKVKAAITALMTKDGWWDSLSDEEKARAQKGSYQVRKALKQRD